MLLTDFAPRYLQEVTSSLLTDSDRASVAITNENIFVVRVNVECR
jgi:hypothetical protein